MKTAVLLLLASSVVASAQQYTRGLGVYPGDPKQYDGPSLVVDAAAYRNLALHRPAYQSSAYDYNLTAQLVTDGIKETALPLWVVTSTSDRGVLPKTEREAFLDEGVVSSVDITGDHPWVQFDIEGAQPPEIDHMDVVAAQDLRAGSAGRMDDSCCPAPTMARAWTEAGRFTGIDFSGKHDSEPSFVVPVVFPAAVRIAHIV